MHSLGINKKLADSAVVLRSSHFKDGNAAPHFSECLNVAQQNNRVRYARDVRFGYSRSAQQGRGRRRKQTGNLLVLEIGRESKNKFPEGAQRRDALQRRQTIDGDSGRLKLLDLLFDSQQVIFRPCHFRVLAQNAQTTARFELGKINAPSQGVAIELVAALFECEQQTFFIFAEGGKELGGCQGLSSAGSSGYEHNRIAIKAAAAHGIQFGNARGDALVRRFLAQLNRRKRKQNDATIFGDCERKFAFQMRCAAKFQNLQSPAALLIFQRIAKDDHIIRNVLFYGCFAVSCMLRRNDGCDIHLPQQPNRAVQLPANDGGQAELDQHSAAGIQ